MYLVLDQNYFFPENFQLTYSLSFNLGLQLKLLFCIISITMASQKLPM